MLHVVRLLTRTRTPNKIDAILNMEERILTNWNLLLNYSMNYEYKTEIFSFISYIMHHCDHLCVIFLFHICHLPHSCYNSFCCEFHMLRDCVLKLKLSNIHRKVFFPSCFVMHTVVDFNEAPSFILLFFVAAFVVGSARFYSVAYIKSR